MMVLNFKSRRLYIALGILALIVVVYLLLVKLVLPPIILKSLNEKLNTFSPVYSVHIERLELSPITMSYRFENASATFKKDNHVFFNIESIQVSIAWREIFRGRILTNVVADGGTFYLTEALIKGSNTPEAKPKEDAQEVANQLFPIRIAAVLLHRSSFQFSRLLGEAEDVRWTISSIEGHLLNLTPTEKNPLTFFNLQGTTLDSARMKISGQAKRLDKPLAWKTDLELRDFNLTAANPMLLRLVPLDFTSGHLDMYSEVLSQKGKMTGYVKTFFKKLKVIDRSQGFLGLKHFAVEVLTALSNAILRRSEDKVLAAKVPFRQVNGNLKVETGGAISSAIEHGFGTPMEKGLEESLKLE